MDSCFLVIQPNCRIFAGEDSHIKFLMKHIKNNTFKVLLSLLLGSVILYWMYRDFDFQRIKHVLTGEMNWTWMLLSFPFGILAQMFRGWRWRQTLEPMGESSRTSVRIHSIFLSYAISLLIPRVGEFARCGVLKRYDQVSFPKALGTVVTERIIDSMLVLLITAFTLMAQIRIFDIFFLKTGTSVESVFSRFSSAGYVVTTICGVAVLVLGYILVKRLALYNKVKITLRELGQGILSLKRVANIPLFAVFTLAIWISYFLHYYLTFFCFEATAHLGLTCALVTFIVGSVAVVVPTPNGAGPWHFAVKTMLMLFGVADADALYFVLIVHSIQTLLVAALGVYAWMALSMTPKKLRRVVPGTLK